MTNLFAIETISYTPSPARLVWTAMHQCYSSGYAPNTVPDISESEFAEKIIAHLLAGDRGHYGPFEHPQISLGCAFFPHSAVQQLRTHRVGVSFDVQSFRYTSVGLLEAAANGRAEEVIYLRPSAYYKDREGNGWEYTTEARDKDLFYAQQGLCRYAEAVKGGMPPEQARGLLPFDLRQHFILSCNMRSLMHLLDLRWKKDAQLECQMFCSALYDRFHEWCPEIAEWYQSSRAKKARLAP